MFYLFIMAFNDNSLLITNSILSKVIQLLSIRANLCTLAAQNAELLSTVLYHIFFQLGRCGGRNKNRKKYSIITKVLGR